MRRVEASDFYDVQGSPAEISFVLQLRAMGVNEPTREWRFSSPRRWRFDFAWVDRRIAVEIEGGSWIGGRHTTGMGYAQDMVKYNAAAELGWRVFRFTPRMVDAGHAAEVIERVLRHG